MDGLDHTYTDDYGTKWFVEYDATATDEGVFFERITGVFLENDKGFSADLKDFLGHDFLEVITDEITESRAFRELGEVA